MPPSLSGRARDGDQHPLDCGPRELLPLPLPPLGSAGSPGDASPAEQEMPFTLAGAGTGFKR